MASEHDLKSLIKFTEREEWNDCFSAVMDAHFGPILDSADIEFEELIDHVGPHWQGTLWGCAFEDFLTLEFDVAGENIVDEYLRRRSWREKPPAKAYMKALRTSIMSLYEVSDVVPGKSMKLRDLLRGGEPVVVSEFSATQSLKQWDKIAARVVIVQGKAIVSGGLLGFSSEACEFLFEGLKDSLELTPSQRPENLTDDQLRYLAPLFTLSWLSDVLESSISQSIPNLINGDGEPIEFHDMRFPLATGVTQKQVAAKLNASSEFEPASTKFWNWLGKKTQGKKGAKSNNLDAQMLETTMEDGRRVFGNIELKGKVLLLSVNSANRAKIGQTLIEQILGDLVRTPLTEIRTVEQMMDNMPNASEREPADEIPPEIAAQLMKQHLDTHYMQTLDEPVPALNNKTPRQAAKTKSGRKQVIEWLKYLENNTAKHARKNDPMAQYDFGWIWNELGIERPS